MALAAVRFLAMAESRINEPIRQAEFEFFYVQTARVLHGYLCRLSRDRASADEILQEAYMRMISAPSMEEKARKAYLYQTATNILRDRWRKQKCERENWEKTQPQKQFLPNLDLPVDMAAILERLCAQDRAVLWLAHVEQLSHREIAKILGLKEKSIKVILFRARGRARDLLRKAGWGVAHEE
jgi:RNA polymerase sigma-70 factor (ECF subfamily)